MNYVQINIGRNHEGIPITMDYWVEFQEHMTRIIQFNELDEGGSRSIDRGDKLVKVVRHYGNGTWNNSEEHSCHLSAVSARGFDIPNIRVALASAKKVWGQEAIALIVGSELI